MNSKKLNAYQIAQKLGICHQTVYNWIDRGLPHEYIKEGRAVTIKFDIDAVKQWQKENIVKRGK